MHGGCQLGCDGWRDDASDRVHFVAAAYEGDAPLLQLVDDDKQPLEPTKSKSKVGLFSPKSKSKSKKSLV